MACLIFLIFSWLEKNRADDRCAANPWHIAVHEEEKMAEMERERNRSGEREGKGLRDAQNTLKQRFVTINTRKMHVWALHAWQNPSG